MLSRRAQGSTWVEVKVAPIRRQSTEHFSCKCHPPRVGSDEEIYSFDRYELRLLPTTFHKKVEQRQVQRWTDSNAKMADTRHLFRWLFNLIEKLKN